MTQEAGDYYKDHNSSWIETYSGIKFSLEDPQFEPIDIAHALANLCRFNGHTRQFYSVAEHSLLVSALVYHMGGNQQQCLEALLHDATEAYMSDVPAPFKQMLPDWKKLDAELDSKLRAWLDLPEAKTGIVKEADWIALFIEAYHLIKDKGESFSGPKEFRDKALQLIEDGKGQIFCLTPDQARSSFLSSWADLSEEGGYDNYNIARQGAP